MGHTRPAEPRLPSVFYNMVTILGAALAGLSLVLIVFLVVLDALGGGENPYMGIIAFTILPVFLILGLVVVAAGAWREHRRRGRGEGEKRLPLIDLNEPRTRRATMIFTVGTVLLLGMTAFGTFKAYEATESVAFCGTTCHTVMEPEYVAYQNSPHARVACVQCHIGPGAEWFVRSKLSGAYQVYAVLADVYPRPIETPIRNLRPSRDTCEQCHWPEVFYRDKYVVHDYWSAEENNHHFRLHLLMKVGGAHGESGHTEGIHWHSNSRNKVEYVAIDTQREQIPWVRSTSPEGGTHIFRTADLDFDESRLDEYEVRRMDCMDCHNRPSHDFHHPARLANQALASGRVSKALPGIKGVMVEALEQDELTSREEAAVAVPGFVRDHYAAAAADASAASEVSPGTVAGANPGAAGPAVTGGVDAAAVATAAAVTWDLYRKNYFPVMRTSWRAHLNHIGHLYSDGCFRCHDGRHESDDGTVIPHDCNVCHTIVAQAFDDGSGFTDLGGREYRHPEDIGGAWQDTNCTECHAP